MKQKILVTGSEGFIGSHVTEFMIKKGYRVKAFILYNSFSSLDLLNNITNRRFKFNSINQSKLTSKIAHSLLKNKKVSLIKFLDFINHHKIVIKLLEIYLKKNRISKKYFIT